MKKFLFLILLISLSTSGCGSKSPNIFYQNEQYSPVTATLKDTTIPAKVKVAVKSDGHLIDEISFNNALLAYFQKYTPNWNINEQGTDDIGQVLIMNIDLYRGNLGNYSGLKADVKLSNYLNMVNLKNFTVKMESQMAGKGTSPSFKKAESANFGIYVAQNILNNILNDKFYVDFITKNQVIEKTTEESNLKVKEVFSNLQSIKNENILINSLKAYNEVLKNDYKPSALPEISSSVLVVSDEGLFPILTEFSSDTPWEPKNLKFDEAVTYLKNKKDEYVVVIKLKAGTVERKEIKNDKINSKYVVEYILEPNPDYEIRQREYSMAVQQYNQAMLQNSLNNTTYTNPWAGAMVGALQGASNAAYANAVDQAKANLAKTSPTRSVPITKDYQYDKMTMEVIKSVPIDIFLIGKKIAQKWSYSFNENKIFNIVYNKRDDDDGGYVSSDNEKDVIEYEKVNVSINDKKIIDSLIQNPNFTVLNNVKNFSFLATSEYKKEIGQIVKKSPEGKISKLMNSVVAIQNNGNKTIGTGFFVKDNIVITNKHVVDNNSFINIKLKNGKKYIGKVVNLDNDIDLALIEVDGKGQPVLFFDKEVEVGEEVIAIGNPLGLEYSLTKGIVSGIRTSKDENRPFAKDHTYIQTDVPINPGNSGGPLFINGKVAGMNTMKIVNTNVEGIGFAIHFKEILSYLKQNSSFDASPSDSNISKKLVVTKKSDEVETKLEKLKNLYENKLINEKEYIEKKKEILNKI